METFCGPPGAHGKYRPPLGYYQPHCQRPIRQGDYSSRTSALLWQEPVQNPKNRVCSIALVVASIFVLVAVVTIAGLAVYMGALHKDNNSLVSFSCSVKLLRGDRFLGNLQEKQRKYKADLETLYHRSILGPSLVSCVVERFGNDTLTIYFRVTFNRKKIPRTITNLEKTLKEVILSDATNKRPVFRNIRFDPKSISVRRIDQRNQPKEASKSGVVLKPKPRPNMTVTASLPVKRKGDNIRGSFTISKTEADITEKKDMPDTTQKTKTSRSTTTPKQGTVERATKPTTTTVKTTQGYDFDQQPWIPINPDSKSEQPIYTSFTNPGFSFQYTDTEALGSTRVRGHPIPVDKIAEVTEASVWETEMPVSELKNISSIFHNLASSLGIIPPEFKDSERYSKNTTQEEVTVGQGQVEVIEGEEASLILQTTKAPLVTLLPVKSNVGVARPLRPRPQSNEHRSFPSEGTEIVTVKVPSNSTKPEIGEFKVSSVLNFDFETRNSAGKQEELQAKRLPQIDDETKISTKAISSSYGINQAGLKILTKTLNKIQDLLKDDKKAGVIYPNKTECSNFTVKCGDGQCLPSTTRCNQLMDCIDGSDEKGCNCADYLRSQYLVRKICDGIVDCWDFSDENNCEWCKIGQYVCSNSKVCMDKDKICDGISDCPLGDDEKHCVTIAPSIESADDFPYNPEGYLLVRKKGRWGKLCVDKFNETVSHTSWKLPDIGRAVCQALTYGELQHINRGMEETESESSYYELSYSNGSSLVFEEAECGSSNVVKIKCRSLECGVRPQALNRIARIVGGGNAGLGAWPWQAALYKEGEFQCGATLLNDRWLLSAGHCFFHSQEEYWVARLGALRRGSALLSPYEQLRPIVRIVIHPGYVDAGFVNDISLLQMESPVIFSDYVRPICLPRVGEIPKDGALCTVVGWGQLFEVGRIFPDTLQEVQVPLISTAECRKRTVFLPLYSVTEDMFCAGFERGGRDACLGDSGGPLMCPESNGRWVLQGVTSNGYGCARANRPGVYTKVANYISWIQQYIDDEFVGSVKSICQGHRCPLGECLPKSRLCNGFIECSNGSDEKDCYL